MTLEEFAGAVAKMRKAQKNFFQSKTNRHLSEAKAAEAEVDRLLNELAPTNVAIRAQQQMLFG